MKKKSTIKFITLLMICLLSFGCTALQENSGTDTNSSSSGSGSDSGTEDTSIPAPTINNVDRNANYSFSADWVLNVADTVTIEQYLIQIKKPGDTNWIDLNEHPSGSVDTYTSPVNYFDRGFGSYYFKMQAIDSDGQGGAYSSVYNYTYSGYLDYVTTWQSFSPEGSDTTSFNGAFATATSIADSKTILFVADKYNNRILQFSENGSGAYQYGSKKIVPYGVDINDDEYSNGFYLPEGVAVKEGIAQTVFVSDSGNNRIAIFDTSNISNSFEAIGQQNIQTINSGISFPYDFYPRFCALSGSNLYVVDGDNKRILKLTFNDDNQLSEAAEIKSDAFTAINWIAIGSSKIYVSDKTNKIFSISESSGSFVISPLIISGPTKPTGLAIDESGATKILYVADTASNRIMIYNLTDGTQIVENSMPVGWGMKGTDKGEFTNPYGLSFSDGKLFVSELGTEGYDGYFTGGRVQVFQKPQ
jgi:hypothetical protein